MILKRRPAEERGVAVRSWLHARFSFSFDDYHHPEHCGFHSLVVMNNDTIEPGGGFATHPHENAEIFTYVISGKLEHRDSMGNGSVILPGNLQYMSAGSGVTHSEFNPTLDQATELYQIWMLPKESGGAPRYSEKKLGTSKASNSLELLFSGDGRHNSTQIRQDAEFYFGQLNPNCQISLPSNPKFPHSWIQVITGCLSLNDLCLNKADGLAIENQDEQLLLKSAEPTEFFLFKLAESK